MKALVFDRNEARYTAANIGSRYRAGGGTELSPLHLADIDAPDLPAPDWVRVAPLLTGICGSDLATVEGRSSRYFEPLVSFPFVPGHEVVGRTEDGRRVALEPTLGPAARHGTPGGSSPSDADDYGYLVGGQLDEGIQVGFCSTTGGGWSEQFVAHSGQLHDVPDALSDEAAVMLEPAAGGLHAALKGQVSENALVAVLGSGTMGLCTIAALRSLHPSATIAATAKYSHQHDLALELGADYVVKPSEIRRQIRRLCGCTMLGDDLAGGADVVIDAVGSSESIAEAIGIARPRGRVALLGMPGAVNLDLTALWHRETELVGAYTYGSETLADGTVTTSFDLAMGLVSEANLGRLVSATYPIERYRDALAHAADAGSRGAVKIAFEFRS